MQRAPSGGHFFWLLVVKMKTNSSGDQYLQTMDEASYGGKIFNFQWQLKWCYMMVKFRTGEAQPGGQISNIAGGTILSYLCTGVF